jgi:hypothetical protein
MSALELIARLRAAGIRLNVRAGKIRLKAEKGALTDELRAEIARHKNDIIALLDAEPGESEPELKALSRTAPLPLSYAQQRLWFLDELEPGTPVYNMPFTRAGRTEHRCAAGCTERTGAAARIPAHGVQRGRG